MRHRRALKSLRGAMELNSLSARAVNVLGRHGICTREQARQANVLTARANGPIALGLCPSATG